MGQIESEPWVNYIGLNNTKITDLPDSINTLQKIKKISFWQPLFLDKDKAVSLELESMFKKLSKCDSLKILELNKNGISEIPESIGLLKSLKKFSASENKITTIPIELFEVKNLEELDLGVNQIIKIPKGIGQLSNLKVLKLNSNWKNKLNTENLFAEIDKLENLQVLELWSCQTQMTIPENILNLKKLKTLDLNNNEIVASFDLTNKLKHLKKLRL